MDIETYIANAYEKLTDYLREKEETKVNAYLDGVKQLYCYDEVTCIGRASNGEAFYKKVSWYSNEYKDLRKNNKNNLDKSEIFTNFAVSN